MSGFDELSPEERAKAGRIVAKIAHDVGKYVAMTARNLPPSGPIPERLVAALARDLYALETGQRASAVFERLAAPLVDRVDEARLRDARSMLAAIDALEADVRAGDVAAVRRAADLARSVEEALRSLARASR